MKRILICGGAGFLGGNLIARLIETHGVEAIMVYDNLSSTGNWDRVPNSTKRTLVEGNIRDLSHLTSRMGDFAPDIVFHLAANPNIAKAVTEPTIDFEQGTVLTQNVLEAMRLNGVRRLIYASGSGVYGDTPETLFEDYGPMEPISTYGASKLASEALICAYCHMFGLTARAFRFANVVGPSQTHGVGYDFLRRLQHDPTKLRILGDGTQTKSYVHVSDAIAAMLLVIDRCSDQVIGDMLVPYAVYNVSTYDTLTVNQIADMAIMASGIDRNKVILDYTGGDRGWKGDVPRVRFNCGKIQALGWRPKMTSKDAVWMSLIAMAEELK
jgi:UDP-glucose 4-epimerase